MFDVFNQQLDLKAIDTKRPANQENVTKKKKNSKIRVIEDEFTHQSSHSVRHEVCIPESVDNYESLSNYEIKERYRTWDFELDPFQEIAIRSIDRNESVLVAAHTSAGKTVTAEYAIAMALRNKQRVVYTSPIKALSNQKYQDFKKIFGDVGLLTGDNTINESSSCLVMTTEILRSMFYLGSEVFRETSIIIFDEVHYLRDLERGVVWEESILLAPKSARFVFLSATIPNASQFASWISSIHEHICHVVYTDFRPVPLTHYIYPLGGECIYNVYDGKNFKNESFQLAMKDIANSSLNRKKLGTSKSLQKLNQMDENPVEKIVKLLTKKNLDPIIMFAFSKKECETYAIKIKLDFNEEEEKDAIDLIFSKALEKLDEEDQQLPQVESLLPILQRGIGIHHSGMLPILKEVVEILFGKGLIKVLFATETFSIGLNMPARTCCFTGLKKFDGKQMRLLSSGEWIQMSGRAGRRGLDSQGLCVMMIDDHVESDQLLGMITGEALPLNSAFRLTYHMLLNLSRVEGVDSRDLLETSFKQYQKIDQLPALEQQLFEKQRKLNDLNVENEELVSQYSDALKKHHNLEEELKRTWTLPKYLNQFLQVGRLVHIKFKDLDFGWGIVVNLKNRSKGFRGDERAKFSVDVLIRIPTPQKYSEGRFHGNVSQVVPAYSQITCFENDHKFIISNSPEMDDPGIFVIVPCFLDTIQHVSIIRANLPEYLISEANREVCSRIIKQAKAKHDNELPLFDFVQDFGIEDQEFQVKYESYKNCRNSLLNNSIILNKDILKSKFIEYKIKLDVAKEVLNLEAQIKEAKAIITLDEHNSHMQLLKKLSYLDSNDVILMKGRVACEISAGDAVLMTELIFDGFFNEMEEEVIVAILSCVVFSEKYDDMVPLPKELVQVLDTFQEMVKTLAKESSECGLEIDISECLSPYRTELIPVAYSWSQGTSFVDICKMTDVYEGSIVRMFRRLDELLRQLKSACEVVGNTELATKFSVCCSKINRGIVFTESLYL
eukprot:NODE_27_length_39007_cov_1.590650.p2 type:complete len:1008 gc:universal NODE_27_length_39007_cov_1.590650:28023-31046(+)